MATSYKRMFQVWAYTVSHGQLLLRSTKTDKIPTRVDILFKDMVALKLPSAFEELEIIESTAEHVGLHQDAIKGRTVWSLRGPGFDGFVVAGAMAVHEDDGEYDAPSRIPGLAGR